jgi:phosphoglucosamine mutase
MGRLFGTDGVRGVANDDLTGDLAYRLGRAAVVVLTEHGESRPQIAVGRDPRASGEFLEAALAAGICSAGGDAVLLGVCTTPEVAFLTTDLGTQAGVVISASHNPALYNGIKFFSATGYKLADEVEDEIEAIALNDHGPRPTGRGVGRIREAADAADRYVEHLARVGGSGALDGMRVVVDCANGAAFRTAPALMRLLGAEAIPINDHPDGWNINDGAGATYPDVLSMAVLEHDADAGVAHDGDADRALFADATGGIVDGDQVLAACALDLHEQGRLPGNAVVTTVMANQGFRLAMRRARIEVVETKVGDRYVLEEMLRGEIALGGEQSGHIIFREYATTGDGLLTAVQFLGLAGRSGRSVADLASCMERFPQVLVNVPLENPGGLDSAEAVWEAVRGAESELGTDGRVLVRPSGTERLVRVMVEAATEEAARRHAESIAAAVRLALG